ncbi:hypothetical protein Lesp02_18830 [Lentzea sp. NBRC 105346]|nr:hypothetical protein Lesp02_18830 [Lentzea sp. NBRC 105346]
MSTAELQGALHQAGVGPAALIPVPTGTVLLPSPATRLGQDLVIADRARKLVGSSVIAYWNADAAVQIGFAGAIGRGWGWGERDALIRLSAEAKQVGFVRGLLDRLLVTLSDRWRYSAKHRASAVAHLVKVVPQADAAAVAARIDDVHTGGVAALREAFEALGLPGVAQVAQLADEGRADPWLAQLPVPKNPRRWYWWLLPPLLVLAVVGSVLADLRPLEGGLIAGALAMVVSLFVVRNIRQPMKGQPINTALPVIPVTQGSAPTE